MMRFYSALLYLYPASFRAEYGRELHSIAAERLRQPTGTLTRLGIWWETILDVFVNAVAAHWDILRQDLRYAARALARSPGFALTAILVTALGVGVNTAAFCVADFVFIRPLPYADADRLMKLWEAPSGGSSQVSPRIYREWKEASSSFEAMEAYYTRSVTFAANEHPQRLESTAVTANLLPMLGVHPLLGRLFEESNARELANGIIISYRVWRDEFGGDPQIIGRQISVDRLPRRVVGVLPDEFHFPNRDVALWRLLSVEEMGDTVVFNSYWEVLAKLRLGVTRDRAAEEMDRIGKRIATRHPVHMKDVGVLVNPLRAEYSSQSRLLLLVLCAAAACVLLIACANLANLLLVRSLSRRKEILMRSALGAGRERLVRQFITESLTLAVAGGVLGIVLAYAALPLFARLVPPTLPLATAPTIDARVLTIAVSLIALTGIGFGVLPAWRSTGQLDLAGLRGGGLRSDGRRRARARSALVIVEVIASVVLLTSAGLLMRALLRLQNVDPGFRSESVFTLRTALSGPQYDTVARRAAFYQNVLAGVRAIRGVSSAAYTTSVPIANQGGVWPVVPDGQAVTAGSVDVATSRFVTPGYFTSLGIPLIRGRDVSDNDETAQPWVSVVSASFAKRYWPNEDPIGKKFKFLDDNRTVVGVVGDVRMRGPEQASEPQVYLAYNQVRDGQAGVYSPKDLLIRSTAPAMTLIPAVRRIVHDVDPQQPVSDIKPLADIVSDATAARSVQVRVLVAFAAIAFLLASIGIHGLLSYVVSCRQHEIGIRVALGAQPRQIARLIIRQSGVLALAGILPGFVLAYAVGRGMRSLLAGIEPADPTTLIAVSVLCVVMTLIGSLLPALRAARVDPSTAFRTDA